MRPCALLPRIQLHPLEHRHQAGHAVQLTQRRVMRTAEAAAAKAAATAVEAEATATDAKTYADTAKMKADAAMSKADANLVWVSLIGWAGFNLFGFLIFCLGWQLRPLREFLSRQLRRFLTTVLATRESTPLPAPAKYKPAPAPIVETMASVKPLDKPLENTRRPTATSP